MQSKGSVQSLFDPFMGSGTVLVEGLRLGMRCHGSDLSPLAAFVAHHQTYRHSASFLEDLKNLAQQSIDEACRLHTTHTPRDTHVPLRLVREAMATVVTEQPVREALLFCTSVLLERSHSGITRGRRRRKQRKDTMIPIRGYLDAIEEYIERQGALESAVPIETPQASVTIGDARAISIDPKVDCILTSPPYPGVYDYLSHAREGESASVHGTPQALHVNPSCQLRYLRVVNGLSGFRVMESSGPGKH